MTREWIETYLKEQLEVVEAFSVVDKEIELIEKQIEAEKTIKKWFLHKLFPEKNT